MTYSTYQTASSIPLAAVAWFVVFMPTPLDAERTMPTPSRLITSEIRSSYVLGNAGIPIRIIDAALTGDHVVDNYHPRTELGRKLLALRRAYVTSGGQLLDGTALDAEVQLQRGGVADV